MLVKCAECGADISDQAASCPHCGFVSENVRKKAERPNRPPIFLVISLLLFVLIFFTPMLLIAYPIVGSIGAGILSLILRERGSGIFVAIPIGIALFYFAGRTSAPTYGPSSASLTEPANRTYVSVWSWTPNVRDAKGNKVVQWAATIQNDTTSEISSAKVEFRTYDNAGKVLQADTTEVHNLSAHSSTKKRGSVKYLGSESNARVDIADVQYKN